MKIRRLMVAMGAVMTALWAAAFTTETITVNTTNLPAPMKVNVIKPDVLGQAGVKVPVIYLLHGYGGDYTNWAREDMEIGKLADQYGIMYVLPDGQDSWYVDSPVNPSVKMESFFVKDLVPYIDSHYATKVEPGQRAITGLSMGGHGALYLGTRHPEIWGNMGSMSGGVNLVPFMKQWKTPTVFVDPAKYAQRYADASAVNLIPAMKANKQNIIFDCGSEDFFHKVNAELHQKMLDAKVPHEYTSRPGNHNWTYWGNSIKYHTLFFSDRFRGVKVPTAPDEKAAPAKKTTAKKTAAKK